MVLSSCWSSIWGKAEPERTAGFPPPASASLAPNGSPFIPLSAGQRWGEPPAGDRGMLTEAGWRRDRPALCPLRPVALAVGWAGNTAVEGRGLSCSQELRVEHPPLPLTPPLGPLSRVHSLCRSHTPSPAHRPWFDPRSPKLSLVQASGTRRGVSLERWGCNDGRGGLVLRLFPGTPGRIGVGEPQLARPGDRPLSCHGGPGGCVCPRDSRALSDSWT